MNNKVYANYANALYELIDKDLVNDYKEAIKTLASYLKENKEVNTILCAYKVDCVDLIKSIIKPFKLPYLEEFVILLNKKHRLSNFSYIADEFTHLCNEYLKIKEGFVYSTSSLNEEQINKIEDVLSKKIGIQVELSNKLDPSLLGGIKVSLDGKIYDNSLKNGLENLTKSLLGER